MMITVLMFLFCSSVYVNATQSYQTIVYNLFCIKTPKKIFKKNHSYTSSNMVVGSGDLLLLQYSCH